MPTPFRRLADRASDDPFFLGYHLRQFATRRLWTHAALAAWLGCPVEQLAHLSLCRTPETDADFAEIASVMGVRAEGLREVMRG